MYGDGAVEQCTETAEAIKEDYQTLILLVVLSLLHMALYLPLPSNDPEAWAYMERG